MNVVFWLLVILAAAGVWVLFWPVFGNIGKAAKDEVSAIKTEMKDGYKEKEKE